MDKAYRLSMVTEEVFLSRLALAFLVHVPLVSFTPHIFGQFGRSSPAVLPLNRPLIGTIRFSQVVPQVDLRVMILMSF